MDFLPLQKNHPFWKNTINTLPKTTLEHVLDATGPRFLTKQVALYMNKNSNIKILDSKFLLPFDWNEKNNKTIQDM